MSEPQLSILIVAYYFPPNAGIGSRRPAQFCRYLPEFEIKPIVLTVDLASCGTVDSSLQTSQDLRIERVAPSTTVLGWFQRRAKNKFPIQQIQPDVERFERASRNPFALRRHLFALLQFPDL